MKKVAIISTVGLKYDGITSVIISYLASMNRKNIEIFVIATIELNPEIEKKINELGCRIVRLPSRQKKTIRYFFSLLNFLRINGIDVVHAHGNSSTLVIEMFAAWLGGVRKRIAHSHNTKCEHEKADKLLRPLFYCFYTDALACSREAGKWLFENRNFIVLKNGRDINKYSFCEQKRINIRNKYGLKDNLVIGHVGAFLHQKNHSFLIEIYREILKIIPDAVLFLIGDGPLREEIKNRVNDIEDKVIFTGQIDNVSDYLQGFDVMVFPSLYEGLPLVLVEGQISGLPCLVSDVITEECCLTKGFRYESLDVSPKTWAEDVLQILYSSNREKDSFVFAQSVRDKGFDIKNNAEVLRNLYMS